MKKRRKKPLTGRARKKPGTGGKGKFYRIVVRSKSAFKTFRAQSVGKGVERLAGKRVGGSWDTQAWLIPKSQARLSGTGLVGTSAAVRGVLSKLGSRPRKVSGNVFRAKPRKNIPEKKKPTPKMRKAEKKNLAKARAARRRR